MIFSYLKFSISKSLEPVPSAFINKQLKIWEERKDLLYNGLKKLGLDLWRPEGAFYNYSKIWDAVSLKYRGPAFGWWEIPDQYSFAQFYRAEASKRNRQPLFTFFATISSHMPFAPTPPYQTDWRRLLSFTPYEEKTLSNALQGSLDWGNFQMKSELWF